MWTVLLGEEFEPEFEDLPDEVQDETATLVRLLQAFGPLLGRPHADTLKGSSHANMKELRFSAADGVWRIAFAFDVKRRVVLLLAGNKSGVSEKAFYRELIRKADARFVAHLKRVKKERIYDMPRDFNDFISKLPASRRREIERRATKLKAEYMTLQELRRARKLTQVRMAKSLGIAQKQISELEKRTDMHLSTLRRAVEAMGGSLEIIAQFPDHAPVHITGIAME